MTSELTVLALGALLLVVHIMLAVHFKTRQYGKDWNMGARDESLPPLNPVAGRLERARDNFAETFPVAIVALLAVTLADKSSLLTEMAAWTWLAARVIYLPLYWTGVPKVRTLVWTVSLLALLVVLGAALVG
ncbi:MAPEG family protein [Altererythrobacter sp. KTW20L]|uniref:MAPEG family protein n=1 Tax=Altererythrobacter sp. KTW20L TaxID=2942210 RepID=UPI0020C15514|nr:MAPEG family protein [Altererythrobacter sp. KTW20L]MCL6250301.1 MAPEG family protein [Altererythrobacter sp. KTW20L]